MMYVLVSCSRAYVKFEMFIKKLVTTHPPKRLCHYGKCVRRSFHSDIDFLAGVSFLIFLLICHI